MGRHRVIAVVQARETSERLPGKVLMPICGIPMLEVVVRRVKRVPEIGEVVVATGPKERNRRIEALCRRIGVGCLFGSEDDVLSRFVEVIRKKEPEVVVRVTADNPFFSPYLARWAIRAFEREDVDYLGTVGSPLGTSVEVVRAEALLTAAEEAKDPPSREHVTLYLYSSGKFHTAFPEVPEPYRGEARLTVDTIEDLFLARCIYEGLGCRMDFDLPEVFEVLKRYPFLGEINRGIEQRRPHH